MHSRHNNNIKKNKYWNPIQDVLDVLLNFK